MSSRQFAPSRFDPSPTAAKICAPQNSFNCKALGKNGYIKFYIPRAEDAHKHQLVESSGLNPEAQESHKPEATSCPFTPSVPDL